MIEVKTKTPNKRPKSPTIQLIVESAPWVLVSEAAKESGLSELLIRQSGIKLRKFGNADYLAPTTLNAWIRGDGQTKEDAKP